MTLCFSNCRITNEVLTSRLAQVGGRKLWERERQRAGAVSRAFASLINLNSPPG